MRTPSLCCCLLLAACGGSSLALTGCSPFLGEVPDDPEPDPEPDASGDGPPVIELLESDLASVTYGTALDDSEVRGPVTLRWEISGATEVTLLENGNEKDLSSCLPQEAGATCAERGSVIVRPLQDTTYKLVARDADQLDSRCTFEADGAPAEPEACAVAEVDVAVFPPALVSLEADPPEVEEGGSVTVHYEVENAASFQIAIVEVVGGERQVSPCVAESEATEDAPCVLPEEGGAVAPTGSIDFTDVTQGFTLGAFAEGQAEDGRGDIADGTYSISVGVLGAPRVLSFELEDATLRPGDAASLQWTTENATSVSVSASPNNVVQADLAGCAAVEESGAGSCSLTLASGAPEGDIVLSLVATSEDGQVSPPASRVVQVGPGPDASFSIEPAALPEGGGEVTLGWSAPGALSATIVADTAPDEPLIDTETGTGDELCGETCEPEGAVAHTTITVSTTWTLRVENEFGPTLVTGSATVEGQPAITSLATGDVDLLAEGEAISDTAEVPLTFATANAVGTRLERAPAPSEGCSVDLAYVEEESFGGEASGSFTLPEVTEATCVKLVALGGADQEANAQFLLVRTPTIDAFSAADTTVARDQLIELSWSTQNALGVGLAVSPGGAVSASELEGCADVDGDGDGACTVSVQPGTPLGELTFTLSASGRSDTEAEPAQEMVTVGLAPVLDDAAVDPGTISTPGPVTISWATTDGARIEVRDPDDALVHETEVLTEVEAGSTEIAEVGETTTWTVRVQNSYGEDEQQVTSYFGPSFTEATVGGEDASGGSVTLITGTHDVAWTAADTTAVEVLAAELAPGTACEEIPEMDRTSVGTGGASGSASLGEVLADKCLWLTAENDAGQQSTLVVQLLEVPEVGALATSPATVSSDGGTVIVEIDARGATELELTAAYLDEQGDTISTRAVCTEQSLNSGSLDGGSDFDSVTCEDAYDDPGNLGCVTGACRLIPNGTSSIRYFLTLSDEEGDDAQADSADGEDVTVE